MTKEQLLEHMVKAWDVDPNKCALSMLEVCEKVIREWERVEVYRRLKACPSCNSTTITRGIVRDYFMCSDSWHDVKEALDIMMTPMLVPTK